MKSQRLKFISGMTIKKMNPDDIKYLVVHCAATKADMDIGAKDIDRWHRERGFRKIGYHFVIRRDGTLETGRELDEPGAHAKGFNNVSIGICLAGGIDKKGEPQDNFTIKQRVTLLNKLEELKALFPKAEILGHRDLPNVDKACPCFDVKELIEENINVPKDDSPEPFEDW